MDVIEPWVGPLIIAFFVVGMVLERLIPARKLPSSRGWYLRGGISFASTMAINALLPMAVASQVAAHAPLSLAPHGLFVGTVAAFVASDFAGYWLHRAQHVFPFFWRWTHQMHHSAERVDVLGAAYFHPFDIAVQALVTTVVVSLLGVSPDAAALAGLLTVGLAVFQHLNVRTPVWLGWLLQRPEGHAIHHARGVHAYNYGNLSLWDLVLGTFRNPSSFAKESGFYDGASRRVGRMLLGRDVVRPPVGERP